MLSEKSWMSDCERSSRPNTCAGALGRDGRRVREPLLLDQLGAAGRVVRRVTRTPGSVPQEALALRQRLRVRVDALAPGSIVVPGQRQQVVRDGQLDLADDRQVVLEQQVVVAVDAAADRVLDRQDAVRGPARRHGGEHVVERLARRAGRRGR